MKSTRADKAEVRKRVAEVLQMRLMGAEFHDISQHAEAQNWNVSERQLWRYIADGDKLLEKTLETNRKKLLNRHIAQRRALYARCMSASDFSNARSVLKDEADLLGLYPPKRMQVSEVSDEEITQAVQEMLAEIEARAEAQIEAQVEARIEARRAEPPGGAPSRNGHVPLFD